MNEGQGSTVQDIRRRRTGTITAATWSNGQFGSCLNFDGATTHIAITGVEKQPPLTVSMWVCPSVVNVTQYTFYLGDSASGTDADFIGMFVSATGKATAIQRRGSGGTSAASTTTLAVGTWYHLVGLFTSHTSRSIYVNGKYEASDTSDETTVAGKIYWRIGDAYGGATEGSWFNGKIDNVMVYERALSAAEIQWLYNEPFAVMRQPIEWCLGPDENRKKLVAVPYTPGVLG
jgi:hypothetical protein